MRGARNGRCPRPPRPPPAHLCPQIHRLLRRARSIEPRRGSEAQGRLHVSRKRVVKRCPRTRILVEMSCSVNRRTRRRGAILPLPAEGGGGTLSRSLALPCAFLLRSSVCCVGASAFTDPEKRGVEGTKRRKKKDEKKLVSARLHACRTWVSACGRASACLLMMRATCRPFRRVRGRRQTAQCPLLLLFSLRTFSFIAHHPYTPVRPRWVR